MRLAVEADEHGGELVVSDVRCARRDVARILRPQERRPQARPVSYSRRAEGTAGAYSRLARLARPAGERERTVRTLPFGTESDSINRLIGITRPCS
jgi:hypothetical protein